MTVTIESVKQKRTSQSEGAVRKSAEQAVAFKDFTVIFETAFREYWSRIYGVLFRMVGDHADAEDLALETFWQLYNRPPRDRQNLGGWLYRVATNLGLNALRANKRRRRYEEEAGHIDLHSATYDPAFEIERIEERQRVQLVLKLIKPRSVRLLVLRHSGLSYAELAVTLKLPVASIGRLLVRAEAEFAKRYRELWDSDIIDT